MGEEEGGMKPIPIMRVGGEQFSPTAQEYIAIQKQRHEQRMQWGFLTILGLAVLGVVIPLGLWLSRIALGG